MAALSTQSSKAAAGDGEADVQNGGGSGGGNGGGGGFAGKAWQQLLRRLANLPLALGEMAALAALSAVGTVIEQNKARAFPNIYTILCIESSAINHTCQVNSFG